MAKRRSITFVSVDIARWAYEVGQVPDGELAGWTARLTKALVLRDPEIHEYATVLLAEAEAFMAEKSEKARLSAETRWHASASDRMQPHASASIRIQSMRMHAKEQSIAEHSIVEQQQQNKTPPLPPTGGDDLKSKFEEARKNYPGTKRGADTEWNDFARKWGKEKAEIIPKLLPAIESQRKQKDLMDKNKVFVPQWKNFKTWVYQRCWEDEPPREIYVKDIR